MSEIKVEIAETGKAYTIDIEEGTCTETISEEPGHIWLVSDAIDAGIDMSTSVIETAVDAILPD
jgi:hypothetical protein